MRLLSAASALLLVAGAATATVHTSPDDAGPMKDDAGTFSIPLSTPLSHAISLGDALTLKAVDDSPIVGYRFESKTVVGEYWPTADIPPEKFLAYFSEQLQAEPEIVAVITERETSLGEIDDLPKPVPMEVPYPEFSSPSAVLSDSARELVAREDKAGVKQRSVLARATTDTWGPLAAYINGNPSSGFLN